MESKRVPFFFAHFRIISYIQPQKEYDPNLDINLRALFGS